MFTLLPPKQKKSLFAQYRLRLLTVFCLFLSGFFIINICLLLPSYISTSIEKEALQDALDSLSKQMEVKNTKGLTKTLSEIKSTLATVEPENTSLYTAYKIILDKMPEGVSLSSLIYTYGKNAESSINLEGIAKTRNDLILFSKELQKEPLFSKAELPISNLAKQSDVQFSFTVLGKF